MCEILAASFETLELETRSQLNRMLSAAAFTNVATDQAERAVQECLASRWMI